ncbi:MAG: hypothetical protein ACOYXO_09230 [Chloroflexota bacterium]
MNNCPPSVFAALIFILLNAFIWLTLGIIIVFDGHPALPDEPLIKGIMAYLFLAAAGILLGLFVLLGKRRRIAYFLVVGFLITTSLWLVFDDFGVVDLVVLAINLVPIPLLIKDRDWYLQARSGVNGSQ